MLPSGSQDRRPCHTGCATCLLVPPFPGPSACARSRPPVQPIPIGPRSLRPVLALALRTVLLRSFCRSRIHLPASLCSTPVTALPSSYEGSDFRHPFSANGGPPRFTTPELLCRSVSNHPMPFHVRFTSLVFFAFWTLPRQDRFPSASFGAPGFAFQPQARQGHQAESSSSRTDRQTRLRLRQLPLSESSGRIERRSNPRRLSQEPLRSEERARRSLRACAV